MLTLIDRNDVRDKPNNVTLSSVSDVIYNRLWLDVIKSSEGKLRTCTTLKAISNLKTIFSC